VVARWPLVGRGQELGELRRLLDAGGAGGGGVALFGEAGVGKTRLVDEAVGAERAGGTEVEWVRATGAARDIPLGSFAHLVAPAGGANDRDDLLHQALSRLAERAGGDGRVLLAVDDAHLLDEVSVALLHLLLTQTDARVVLSVRTGEPLPPGLVGLWKDELVSRLDVGPLSRQATEELVLTVLGDGVPASLLDRIWHLSRGNVLFVRELVTTAIERRASGAGGPVSLPAEGGQARLRELVEEHLRLIEPRWRTALEIVAVGQQVPLDAAQRLIHPLDIEALEQRGLVEVMGAGGAEIVQAGHPLHGEVLAAGVPRLRRRAVLRDLVEAVRDVEWFDSLRLATWRLESGDPGDPDELLGLARDAMGRLDHRLAERLARAAGGASRPEAGRLLGEALAGQSRIEESEAVLAELRPADPEQVARVAMARAANLFLHLDRSTDAFAVLRAADADLEGQPEWRAECRSILAQMLMFSFRLPEAGQMAEDLLADRATPETARVRAAPVALTARSAAGHLDAGLDLLDDELFASAERHRREVPYGGIQLRMARYQATYWAGRYRELDDYTAADMGLEMDHPPPSLGGILSGFRGGALLVRGRARAGLAELERSVRALAESDWFGQRPLAEAMRARAAVFAGELDVAAEALAAADAAYAADMLRGARTLPYIELSRCWLLGAQGSISEAADRCLALAAALEHAAAPLAVEVAHAALRLGRPAEALELADRLAAVVDGPLAPAVAGHARALAAEDPDALAAAAGAMEALGADLVAAEALRAASNAYRRAGRGVPAATAARRVTELLEACGRPQSPALEPVAVVGEELTDREREVAVQAARGRTSPEIATALFLSVRTVDTHLHRVYRKLMIDGRHQLADALGIVPGEAPGSAPTT
jgi:DNA-binding NarL/FixJ family response regulator